MLLIDLSANNADPDLRAVKAEGVIGLWHKASEGHGFRDTKFTARRRAANDVGLRFGAYHYARPDLHPFAPRDEAANFCRAVVKLNRRDLRPALDYERLSSHGNDEWWIREFNHEVVNRLGVGPLFYTYPAHVRAMKLTSTVGYGLWLADYVLNDGTRRYVRPPAPWVKWVAHQYTSCGKLDGCIGYVDLNYAPKLRPILARPLLGLL